jgi:hypothetical protein
MEVWLALSVTSVHTRLFCTLCIIISPRAATSQGHLRNIADSPTTIKTSVSLYCVGNRSTPHPPHALSGVEQSQLQCTFIYDKRYLSDEAHSLGSPSQCHRRQAISGNRVKDPTLVTTTLDLRRIALKSCPWLAIPSPRASVVSPPTMIAGQEEIEESVEVEEVLRSHKIVLSLRLSRPRTRQQRLPLPSKHQLLRPNPRQQRSKLL